MHDSEIFKTVYSGKIEKTADKEDNIFKKYRDIIFCG